LLTKSGIGADVNDLESSLNIVVCLTDLAFSHVQMRD
jgi:hypothetical protein